MNIDPSQTLSGFAGNIGNAPPEGLLSGLNFAGGGFSGGAGADSILGGGGQGMRPGGGQQPGPGLDFFQMMAQLQGAGGQGDTGAPNLSSLLSPIGNQGGGIGPTSLGQNFTAGQMGPPGLTAGQTGASQSGIAGGTGGTTSDPLAMLQKILGLIRPGVKAAQELGGLGGGNTTPTSSPTLTGTPGDQAALATGQETPPSQSLAESGLFSFLNDPKLQDPTFQLNTMGLLQGSESPESFLSSLSPQQSQGLMQAMMSGQEGATGLGTEGLSLGANLNLTDPTLAPSAAGGLGSAGSWAGLIASILGQLAGPTGSKELGLAAQGIGTGAQLASLGSNIGTLASGVGELGLGAGAGLAFAPVALGATAFGLSDMFNNSAQDFAKSTKSLFGSVPGQMQALNRAPGLAGQLGPGTSPQDALSIYDQLNSIQENFQGSGVENLFKQGGRVTGENTQYGLFGGGDNFSAQYPGIQNLGQVKGQLGALTRGRLRAQDIVGGAGGQFKDPYTYARALNPSQDFLKALFPLGEEAVYQGDPALGYVTNPADIMPMPGNPSVYVNPTLWNQMQSIAPGNYQQGLRQLMAPYGGFDVPGTQAGLY